MFLIVFVIAGFVTKVVAEVMHEVFGHGSFVLLFGGQITSVDISLVWPYDFSRINWSFPNGISSIQMAWVYAGGILVCLCLSFLFQVFLIIKKEVAWYSAVTLFWLAFWTFISSTGYLIIGGLAPFGDIYELIKLGALTRFLSLSIGLIIFIVGFVVLSWILRKSLMKIFTPKKARLGVTLFWLIIPALVIVMLANPERDLQLTYLPLAFMPSLLSFIIENFLISSKQ
jgi:hypothetical protein